MCKEKLHMTGDGISKCSVKVGFKKVPYKHTLMGCVSSEKKQNRFFGNTSYFVGS